MNTKQIGLVAAVIIACLNISPVFAQAGTQASETTVVVPAEDAIKTSKEDDGVQIIAIPPYIPTPPKRNSGSRTERPAMHIPE